MAVTGAFTAEARCTGAESFTKFIRASRIKAALIYGSPVKPSDPSEFYWAQLPKQIFLHACAIGDVVTIVETRPLSKRKRWMVLEIVQKAGE